MEGSALRILLVEDELGVRLTLAGNLELEGFEVTEADSAESALELLQSGDAIDLVLSDIRMPGMSGVALAKQVRQLRPELPIVLMTAFTEEEELGEGVEAGVYTVLSKPFDVERTIQTLRRVSGRPKILVVDDEESYARTLAGALRAAGLDVVEAHDGDSAIQAARLQNVDVCVTDLRMPGVDGVEVARRVREAGPDVQVIVFSGHDVPMMMAQAAEGGVFACLRKPMDVSSLMRVIANARSGG